MMLQTIPLCYLFFSSLFFVSIFSREEESAGNDECALYLADSRIHSFGRGVFAGKSYQKNDILFEGTTVLVSNDMSMQTMLAYYVFTDENEDYEIFVFGPTLLLNHADKETIDYRHVSYPVDPPSMLRLLPYSNHTPFQLLVENNPKQGDELFTNYGNDWFKDREIEREPVRKKEEPYTADELKELGHCLTDIYVAESDIPSAGKGVFAKKSFKKGEVVSISPVLVLPLHAVERENERSVLLNYCITAGNASSPNGTRSDVALLPLGLVGMINHGSGEMANVAMDWYLWSADQNIDRLNTWSVEDLEEAQAAPLDLQYIATRDIRAGEELLVSYGIEWERAWKNYLTRMLHWHEVMDLLQDRGEDISSLDVLPPQFRAPISAPPGMFPESFLAAECLGTIPCENMNGDMTASDVRKLMHTKENRVALERTINYADQHLVESIEVSLSGM